MQKDLDDPCRRCAFRTPMGSPDEAKATVATNLCLQHPLMPVFLERLAKKFANGDFEKAPNPVQVPVPVPVQAANQN